MLNISNKQLKRLTRILSLAIIAFSVIMFLGYTLFPESEEPASFNTKEIIGFAFVVVGFIGLLLAWKWELIGSIISIITFIGSAVIFPRILIPSPIYIWPLTAALFIVLWYRKRNTNE